MKNKKKYGYNLHYDCYYDIKVWFINKDSFTVFLRPPHSPKKYRYMRSVTFRDVVKLFGKNNEPLLSSSIYRKSGFVVV